MDGAYPIRLVAQWQKSAYVARWVEEGGQESESFALELPLKEADTEDLRWYLEEFTTFVGAGTRVRAHGVEKRIEAWGKKLFEACFGGAEGTHVYRNLLEATKAKRQVLLTLGSNDNRFLQQPWELMRDRRGPLAFRGVSIRRQLVGAKAGVGLAQRFDLPLRLFTTCRRPRRAGVHRPAEQHGAAARRPRQFPACRSGGTRILRAAHAGAVSKS